MSKKSDKILKLIESNYVTENDQYGILRYRSILKGGQDRLFWTFLHFPASRYTEKRSSNKKLKSPESLTETQGDYSHPL